MGHTSINGRAFVKSCSHIEIAATGTVAQADNLFPLLPTGKENHGFIFLSQLTWARAPQPPACDERKVNLVDKSRFSRRERDTSVSPTNEAITHPLEECVSAVSQR